MKKWDELELLYLNTGAIVTSIGNTILEIRININLKILINERLKLLT